MAKAKVELIYKTHRIKVEPNKILAEKINPPAAIRKAVQVDENTVMKVRSASTPKPRADTAERVVQIFKGYEEGKALREMLHPLVTGEDEEAKNKNLTTLAQFVSEAMREIPLEGTSRVSVDEDGVIVEKSLVKNFQVVGVEDGIEQLAPFPRLEKTKEYFIGDDNMYPRIYEANMLQAGDYLYELPAVDDVNRFALAELYADMSDYTKKDGTYLGEVMAVIQPVYLIGGTTQEYIAIITPKRIVEEDGTEKFTMIMKLSQSNIAYTHAMLLPKPGETPKTISSKQEPLRTVGFAQLVQAMKAAQ